MSGEGLCKDSVGSWEILFADESADERGRDKEIVWELL
jgi:hypothetical protein